MDRYEWDESKRASNFRRHGIDFSDVIVALESDYLLFGSDRNNEERWKALGQFDEIIVAIAFSRPDDDIVRIISARPASRHERKLYHARYG